MDQETLRVIRSLDNTLQSLNNSIKFLQQGATAAYVTGNIPGNNNNSGNFDKKSVPKKLEKTIEKSSTSMGKSFSNITKRFDTEGSGLLKIINAISNQLGRTFSSFIPKDFDSHEIRLAIDKIRDNLDSSNMDLNIDELVDQIQNNDLPISLDNLIEQFGIATDGLKNIKDVFQNVAEGSFDLEVETKRLMATYSTFKELGIDLVSAFEGLPEESRQIGEIAKSFLETGRLPDDIAKDTEKIQKFVKTFNKSLDEFIDDTTDELFTIVGSIEDLRSAVVDEANSFKTAFGEAAERMANAVMDFPLILGELTREGNALMALNQQGFGEVDINQLIFSSIEQGLDQANFARAVKDFQSTLRLFGNTPDAMAAATGVEFASISKDIREDFGLIGQENFEFLGNQMRILQESGLRPDSENIARLNETFETLSILSDLNPQEVQEKFSDVANDPSFQLFNLSMGKSRNMAAELAESFIELEGQVGSNVDAYIKSTKAFLSQTQALGGVDRLQQGVFTELLADTLGFTKAQGKLLGIGASTPEALDSEQFKQFQSLRVEFNKILAQTRTDTAKLGIENAAPELELLQILSTGAGTMIDTDLSAAALRAEQTGETDLMRSDAFIKATDETEKFTGNLRIAAAELANFAQGLAQSPIGATLAKIGGVVGSLAIEFVQFKLLESAIKGTKLPGIPGAITSIGSNTMARLSAAGKSLSSTIGNFATFIQKVDILAPLKTLVRGATETGKSALGFGKILNSVSSGIQSGSNILQKAGSIFKRVVNVLGSTFSGLTKILPFISTITGTIGGLFNAFKTEGTLLEKFAGFGVGFFDSIVESIAYLPALLTDWLFGTDIKGFLDETSITQMFVDFVDKFTRGFLTDGFELVDNIISSTGNAIDSVASFFYNIPGDIKSGIGGMMDWAIEAGENIKNTLVNFLNNLPENIMDGIGDLTEWAAKLGQDLKNAIGNFIKEIPEKMIAGATGTVGDVASGVRDVQKNTSMVLGDAMDSFFGLFEKPVQTTNRDSNEISEFEQPAIDDTPVQTINREVNAISGFDQPAMIDDTKFWGIQPSVEYFTNFDNYLNMPTPENVKIPTEQVISNLNSYDNLHEKVSRTSRIDDTKNSVIVERDELLLTEVRLLNANMKESNENQKQQINQSDRQHIENKEMNKSSNTTADRVRRTEEMVAADIASIGIL